MTIASFVAILNDRGLADAFVAWLAWSFKGTLLLVVAWAATVVLRRGPAAIRHLVWVSAFAGMLSLPLFARVVPPMHPRWLSLFSAHVATLADASSAKPVTAPRTTSSARNVSPAATVSAAGPAVARPIREIEFNISNDSSLSVNGTSVVAIAWILGVALLLLRAMSGLLQLSLWSRNAEGVHDADWLALTQRLALELEIGRPVTLLRSDRACVPMTWGVVYPRILLPADADSWVRGRRTVVLLHELAHIKRLDTLTQLLAQMSTALFWFHPGVWFAAREMRREREHACDDFVLDAGARASDYAHSLLEIARPLVGGGAPAAAALAMARKTELEGRLLAILDPRIDRRHASRLRLTLASAALIGLAIPLAAVSPSHARRQAAPPPVAVRAAPADAPRNSEPATSAVVPPPTVAVERPASSRLNMIARAPRRTPDVETLIAVTRAATKMTSDHDKAEVLLSVARHYVRNDELRSAYFDAVLSMHSDFERTRVLEPVLMKDTIPASASPQFVKVVEAMSSDNVRGSLVLRLAGAHPSMTPTLRSALISVAGSLHTDYERTRAITAIARRGDLSADETLRLIVVAKSLTSSVDKANSLLAIAGSRPLDTPELRRAYLEAAETISSPSDYRRAVIRVIE